MTAVAVPVRDVLGVAVDDEETVDVFDTVIDDVAVRVFIDEAVFLADADTEFDAVDVLEGRMLKELVGDAVPVLDGGGVLVSVGLPVRVFERPADTVFVLEDVIVRVEVLDEVSVDVLFPDIDLIALNVLVLDATVERVLVLVDVAVLVERALKVCRCDAGIVKLAFVERVDVFDGSVLLVGITISAMSIRGLNAVSILEIFCDIFQV